MKTLELRDNMLSIEDIYNKFILRGKTINGTWVYGNLWKESDVLCLYKGNYSKETKFPVRPETICRKITDDFFENDILKIKISTETENIELYAALKVYHYGYVIESDLLKDYINENYIMLNKFYDFENMKFKNMELVGNIYENFDLMNEIPVVSPINPEILP